MNPFSQNTMRIRSSDNHTQTLRCTVITFTTHYQLSEYPSKSVYVVYFFPFAIKSIHIIHVQSCLYLLYSFIL